MTLPVVSSKQIAEDIVSTLFVPNDPDRWGESPVSTEELIGMIAQAIDNARQDRR